jgi:glycosyltransferase involved in cell wall biosynthesis
VGSLRETFCLGPEKNEGLLMNNMIVSNSAELHETTQQPAAQTRPPMKIAYMMSRFPKISETFILYEILEQERLGNSVEVYPLLREHQPVMHPEAERLVARAHFHPFISLPIIFANMYFILRRPITYFKTVFEILGGTLGSPNFFLGAIAYFPKSVRCAYEMKQQGIQHIHAHFCNHPALAALIIHRLTGIPFSFTAHGSDLHKDKRMLDKKTAASAFAVTISNFNKGEMIKACGETLRDKIQIIRCGIDPEVFLPTAQKNGKSLFRIICVGSFEEVKGHKYLVEACRLLREAGIDFICDLIGDGPVRQQIAQQIAEADLKDKVILHGSRKRQDVADMMRAADVKVLASVPTAEGKREGVPVVIMEAMASGLPVISTQLSGIPELVENERTGILVQPGDTEALLQALLKLYHDPDLRFKMGQAGREKILTEFNLRVNVIKLADLFSAKMKRNRYKF